MTLRRITLATTLALALVALPPSHATAAGKKILIHVKTALNKDDAQICVVPNVAWAALQAGNDVTLLFDGSAVTSVTKGWGWRGWFGAESTPMDRADLPERERRALSEQLVYPLDKIPHDYGEYLRFLKDKGVKLYINKTMTVLYNIDADRIDLALTPVLLKDMVDLFQAADRYLVY
jgi:predicted peroxiredoxin